MAKLIGYLHYGHHAGSIHRLAHKQISAELATWDGKIETTLNADGTAYIYVNGKQVFTGNINKEDNKKGV